MPIVRWDERYATGLPLIDEHHRELFRRLNAFHDAMKTGSARATVEDTLRFLLEYVTEHFREEERQMRAAAYPDFPHHKALHDKLEAKTRALLRQHERGEAVLTTDLSQFLTDWVTRHILVEDMAFLPWFRSRGLGDKPLPPPPPF